MPNIPVGAETNNGIPLVEPPAGFGDSPVKNCKPLEIKEATTQIKHIEESTTLFKRQESTEKECMEIEPVIKSVVLPKPQFANVEMLPNTDNQEQLVEVMSPEESNCPPTYHRPTEMQIEELTSLSSALDIGPLEEYNSGRQSIEKPTMLQLQHPDCPETDWVQSKNSPCVSTSTSLLQETSLKEISPSKNLHTCVDKKQRSKTRKSSSGSRERICSRSNIMTSSSNASIQSVQTTSDTTQGSVSGQSLSKVKTRSRSSSKERLLSTLANSHQAPVTSHEEDDISGTMI